VPAEAVAFVGTLVAISSFLDYKNHKISYTLKSFPLTFFILKDIISL
jgi:hypothetical protein